MKIWKNTNLIDAYSMGLDFTDKKDDAELILLGSRKIEITDFPKVKGIFRAGAGKENVPEKHCTENNIKIMYPSPNTMNELFDETANFAVQLIFKMLYQNINVDYGWKKIPRENLKNKNLLIIGLGNIGKKVKEKMRNFVNIITYDVLENSEDTLDDLLKLADVISLHIPGTQENKAFLNNERLQLLKDNAIIINTSRGSLVCEDSLYEEFENNRLTTAFDVFWEEPYEGKLCRFHPERFFMTPHIASSSIDFIKGCRADLDNFMTDLY